MKTFRDAVRTSDFAIAAEIFLRAESDAAALSEQAAIVRDDVDAILLTDNQYGQVHMSTIAAASILLDCGVDPIVQLTSRNRNRIALVSDLLGAAAIGVSSVLLVAGERAPKDFKPRPKSVLDLSATDLVRTAATINKDDKRVAGPDFLIGAAVTPVIPGADWKAKKLLEKIDAGAHFLQTHTCMDIDLLRRYLRHLVSNKLIRKTSVIGAVAVLESVDDAHWLRDNRPNVMLPDKLVSRLERAAEPKKEGIAICAETIRAMKEIPGMVGVCIMASRDLTSIPAVIRAAGL